MTYQEWHEGLEDAKRTMRLAKDVGNTFANALLSTRMAGVAPCNLADMKRMLKRFNMRSLEWDE